MVEYYPHQISGADWLAQQKRCGLFDEQGLGKTITAIRAAHQAGVRKMLVVAPSIVLWNWRREIEKFWQGPGRASVNLIEHGDDPVIGTALANIVTHGLLLRPGLFSRLLRERWDLIVLDEAQFFRGADAQRTHLFYGLHRRRRTESSPAQGSLVDSADRVWLLTGTPTPNNALDLWPFLRGLWPSEVPLNADEFRQRFCVWRETRYGIKITGNANVAELRALLAGKFLRRLKKDHLPDLPPIRFEVLTLSPAQLPWELRVVELQLRPKVLAACVDAVSDMPDDVGAGWDALRNSVDGARFRALCGLAKVGVIVELLSAELESGEVKKVGVIAHHSDVVEGIRAGLARFGAVSITGADSAKTRFERVEQFQRDPKIRVVVLNVVAGGTGVTLTAASEVVFAEMSWVPGDNAQAADRFHRIGQTERVRVRCIALANTIDEQVTATLRTKVRMIREILS